VITNVAGRRAPPLAGVVAELDSDVVGGADAGVVAVAVRVGGAGDEVLLDPDDEAAVEEPAGAFE
jgi:hypothetical protein